MKRLFALLLIAAPLFGQVSNPSGALNPVIANSTSASPTSGATLYIGMGGGTSTTLASVPRWKAPRACTVTSFAVQLQVLGTKDSGANNLTFKVYDATTSTAFTDSAVTLTAQNTQAGTSVSSLSDAIAAGDEIVIQLVSPTYTATPTTVFVIGQVYCQ